MSYVHDMGGGCPIGSVELEDLTGDIMLNDCSSEDSDELCSICLTLPEAHQLWLALGECIKRHPSGSPTFFVGGAN